MEKKQCATLLVRHLPESIPGETLKRLFSHYGASDLRTCVAGRLKNCAFVDFDDEVLAARAQSQLHRLRFLGKTLLVERARPQGADGKEQDSNKRKADEAFLLPLLKSKISSSGPCEAEPIAPSLGVDYPFPPHLDSEILHAATYMQVLHLMNKMNLPAPFRPSLPAPPLPSKHAADLASDESELESSGEEDDGTEHPKKRRMEPIVGPALAKDASHEAAGVKPIVTSSKLVPSIKKKQPVIQIKIAPKAEPPKRNEEESLNSEQKEEGTSVSEPRKVATKEELEQGKLPLAEAALHPLLKNYAPGNPSPVLYIKNLEKDVVKDDLFYVFGAFFSSLEEVQTEINIKLMQEGRMKGQAFVRFPSVHLAQDALAGAHLYILKGKPMIIQFGRKS